MTDEQRAKLQALVRAMRVWAARTGPMHSWWDAIFDIEALLRGEKALVTMTPDEWIAHAEERLAQARTKGTFPMFATAITRQTMLGRSNCFSVEAEGREYRIVNFYHETLEDLLACGVVAFPLGIRPLDAGTAVLHDARIPDFLYPDFFCEVCCPDSLLPLPQQLAHERETEQGVRREYPHPSLPGVTMIAGTFGGGPQLPAGAKVRHYARLWLTEEG